MMGNNLSETTSLCGGQPPADSRTPRSYAARRKVVSVVSKYARMKNADAPARRAYSTFQLSASLVCGRM
jgi:hypothetical protein